MIGLVAHDDQMLAGNFRELGGDAFAVPVVDTGRAGTPFVSEGESRDSHEEPEYEHGHHQAGNGEAEGAAKESPVPQTPKSLNEYDDQRAENWRCIMRVEPGNRQQS